jgi:hypothetical protein
VHFSSISNPQYQKNNRSHPIVTFSVDKKIRCQLHLILFLIQDFWGVLVLDYAEQELGISFTYRSKFSFISMPFITAGIKNERNFGSEIV